MKKQFLFVLVLSVIIINDVCGQSKTAASSAGKQKFMQITTIESVVAGGFGRSKIIITKDDGSQEERDLENLFSLAGINLKNTKSNESSIVQILRVQTEQGWQLMQVTPLTLSPGGNGPGIFMTRYLFSKQE
jgi:hypothetical protein